MMTQLLFREDVYMREARAEVVAHTPEGGIVLDRTVFYATGGGQPGDSGILTWSGASLSIASAVKIDGEQIALVPSEPSQMPQVGQIVEQSLDWERRHRHMRVHTALHLLSVVIPLPVTGGAISSDRGRLDFAMPEPPADKMAIEEALCEMIDRDLLVTEDWISEAELDQNKSLVKTLSVQPPRGAGRVRLIRIGQGAEQVDIQPCGGTHVARTSEIGRIKIGKIENKGKQNRRVTVLLDS